MAGRQGRGGLGAWRNRMGGWSAGIDFAATAMAAVIVGYAVDLLLGTSPYALLVGVVVGVVGGFTAFLRTALRINRSGEDTRR